MEELMMMLEMERSAKILDKLYEDIRTLSDKSFMSLIGTIIDQYGADHGWTSEQTLDVLKTLADVQKSVHEQIGMPNPTGVVVCAK